jgi:hypothetical protein
METIIGRATKLLDHPHVEFRWADLKGDGWDAHFWVSSELCALDRSLVLEPPEATEEQLVEIWRRALEVQVPLWIKSLAWPPHRGT